MHTTKACISRRTLPSSSLVAPWTLRTCFAPSRTKLSPRWPMRDYQRPRPKSWIRPFVQSRTASNPPTIPNNTRDEVSFPSRDETVGTITMSVSLVVCATSIHSRYGSMPAPGSVLPCRILSQVGPSQFSRSTWRARRFPRFPNTFWTFQNLHVVVRSLTLGVLIKNDSFLQVLASTRTATPAS